MLRKTLKRQQKGRALGSSKPKSEPNKSKQIIQFADPMNAVWAMNEIPSSATHPNYLDDLYAQLRKVLPPNTNIHSNNAEIMGALMETNNSPENMRRAVNLIYETEPITNEEKIILGPFIRGPSHRNISRIAATNLSPELKQKFLMQYRRNRATKKLKRMYNNTYVSKYTHPEWNEREE